MPTSPLMIAACAASARCCRGCHIRRRALERRCRASGSARVDRDHAAQRLASPTRPIAARARSRPGVSASLVEQFEARLVAGGGIVEADAVDEQQAVIGLGAADADLGLGAARARCRDRDAGGQPQHVAGQRAGRAPRDRLRVEHGGRNRRVLGARPASREPVTTIASAGRRPLCGAAARAIRRNGFMDNLLKTTTSHVVSEDTAGASVPTMPRAAGWTRPDADDSEGRSPGFAGHGLISPVVGEGLAAYSCGHSAGFDTGFPFHHRLTAAPSLEARLGLAAMACQSAGAAARGPHRLSRRLVGTSRNTGNQI